MDTKELACGHPQLLVGLPQIAKWPDSVCAVRRATMEMALLMGNGKRAYDATYETSPRYSQTGEVNINDVVVDAEWGRACALSELGADGEELARAAYHATQNELGRTKFARRRNRFLRSLANVHGHKHKAKQPCALSAQDQAIT